MGAIQGVAADRFGNLYLSDTDNHRVRKVNAAGTISTVAGTGAAGFSGDGGPASEARLNLPYGLAVDSAGNVYMADLGNNRVRRVAPMDASRRSPAPSSGAPRATAVLAGRRGSSRRATSPMDSPATFTSPSSQATACAASRPMAGSRPWLAPASRVSAAMAGRNPALLDYPAGLAIDRAGSLYIADSGNDRIRKIAKRRHRDRAQGGCRQLSHHADRRSRGHRPALCTSPTAASWCCAQRRPGPGSFRGRRRTGTCGRRRRRHQGATHPAARLTASPTGALYIADGARVRLVDARGHIQTVAGDGYLHAVGDGGAASAAMLNHGRGGAGRAGNL